MAKNYRDPARERMWRERVSAWAASGLSVRAFCDQHQLTETTFQYWRRELRGRDAASSREPSPPAGPPAFVPVTILPNTEPALSSATFGVEVRCPSGHVVSLSKADVATLRSLFAALAPLAGEASPC